MLVTTRDLAYGAAIDDADTAWLEWPKESAPKGVVRKSEAPNAKNEIRGQFVRVPIANGEPLRRERLIEAPTAKIMSAILSPGYRAVAIDITPQGANAAGGFILPNDHVDVIRTFRGQAHQAEIVGSETIVTNARVLAMGQTVEMKNGESVVTAVTATLELDPRQAELVALGQQTGRLTLALRAMADWRSTEDSIQPASAPGPLSRTSNALGGRLTIPRDSESAPTPGDTSQAGLRQKQNLNRRQVLNAN